MIPHTLVLKPGLVVHSIYNGYWFWGRPSVDDLWRDLRAATSEIRPDWDLGARPREAWDAGDSLALPRLGQAAAYTTGTRAATSRSPGRRLGISLSLVPSARGPTQGRAAPTRYWQVASDHPHTHTITAATGTEQSPLVEAVERDGPTGRAA